MLANIKTSIENLQSQGYGAVMGELQLSQNYLPYATLHTQRCSPTKTSLLLLRWLLRLLKMD